MLSVGITGGIGSGKSVVCRVFAAMGIPVLSADETARFLMEHDTGLITAISELLGQDSYNNGLLNRAYVADAIFKDAQKLKALNALVHPATVAYGKKWREQFNTAFTIKEAALFFESGSSADIDFMIGVSAPQEIRIARAMRRSNMSREQVLAVMAKQMDETEKMKRCHAVIINDDTQAILPQVLYLYQHLTDLALK